MPFEALSPLVEDRVSRDCSVDWAESILDYSVKRQRIARGLISQSSSTAGRTSTPVIVVSAAEKICELRVSKHCARGAVF